jgi:hypothetical protein
MIFVRDHMAEYKRTGDRNLLYLEAAGGVIRQFLGIAVFSGRTDPYLDAKEIDKEKNISYVFPLRVLLFGETIFLLRSCDGFAEMCERLKEQRDLRSAFYELRAARMFFDAGFKIHVKPQRNRLGEDFDFMASRDDLQVNVEATALKEKDFNEQTALNALKAKREQLATDKPAVIFCLFPSSWEGVIPNINEWAAQVAEEFLRPTRRVNVVVFQIERRIDWSGQKTGAMFTVSKAFFNEAPRHSADLSFLFEADEAREEREMLMRDMRNPARADGLAKKLRTSEFYRWVDHLVP